MGANCANCKQYLSCNEIVRRAQDNVYHPDCFKCFICNKLMETGDSFYLTKDKKLICDREHDQMQPRGS